MDRLSESRADRLYERLKARRAAHRANRPTDYQSHSQEIQSRNTPSQEAASPIQDTVERSSSRRSRECGKSRLGGGCGDDDVLSDTHSPARRPTTSSRRDSLRRETVTQEAARLARETTTPASVTP